VSAGFQGLVAATGPGDLSKLIALRALVDRVNGDGSVERANWLTGVREEYQRWYARHQAAGHPENFPADETLRYLDEHIVRTLAVEGVLQPVVIPGGDDQPGTDREVPWHAVRLSTWAAAEVEGERPRVLDLLDTRIRAILEHTNDAGPAAAVVDLPPAPQLDGPAVHAESEPEVHVPGEMLVPGGATLSARGLVKVYRKRRVVNEVDIQVSQGEIVGLLGPNGAGKTTSFYMMVGLIRPDKGKVFIGQRDLTGVPMYKRARAGIGYLAQEPSIFRKLTVEENVMAILQMMRIPRKQRKARLEQLLDELSIKHLRKTRAYALSGGERRRLEITRALVGNPKFMLLDEPFAGVDPIAVHDIQQIVSDLRRRGIGVLISDHNVEQTLDIVDRAYIMYDGRVRVSGTVSELVWNEEVAEIYLGPTLTARMRERYTDPALDRRGDAPAGFGYGGPDPQMSTDDGFGDFGRAESAGGLEGVHPGTSAGFGYAAPQAPAPGFAEGDRDVSAVADSAEGDRDAVAGGSVDADPDISVVRFDEAEQDVARGDSAAGFVDGDRESLTPREGDVRPQTSVVPPVDAAWANDGAWGVDDGYGRPRAALDDGAGPVTDGGDDDDERDGAEHGPGTHG
jgi:lipopolysaccharide export system ATP-binding protein